MINLIIKDKSWNKNITKKFLKNVFFSVLDYLKIDYQKTKILFSITLSNDDEIKKLNKQYRNINKVTNVLTFSLYKKKSEIINNFKNKIPCILLGDIVFSYQTLQKESIEQNKTFKNHFTHLLIHSYLHLLAYDHIKPKEQKEMESIEIKILKKFGIKNPYLI